MENDQPILTVAIPTYNGEKTIRTALDMLLKQYTPKMEILICDNCSTDRTPEIVNEYLKRYPFIWYVRNEQNLGPDGNFLKCLQIARGRFVHLLSDDDILVDGALQAILEFLELHPNVSLLYLNVMMFYEHYTNPESCNQRGKKIEKSIYTKNRAELMAYAGMYIGLLSAIVYSKEKFCQIPDFNDYQNTNWLQTYIAFLCLRDPGAEIGLIRYPCIAWGSYSIDPKYDNNIVFIQNYKKLFDFAVENAGFDKRQMEKIYVNMLCNNIGKSIIKEKSSGGISDVRFKDIFPSTRGYFRVWLQVYPLYLVPDFVCRFAMKFFRQYRYGYDKVETNYR